MIKEQAECRHTALTFQSGDYYIQCTDCPALWVMRDPRSGRDVGSPQHANRGVGSSLSGELRQQGAVIRQWKDVTVKVLRWPDLE